MHYWFIRFGGTRMLVTRPDTRGFGNAVLNMAMSFHMARQVEARLIVAPTDPARYRTVCGIRCGGVQVRFWSGRRARAWCWFARLVRAAAPALSRMLRSFMIVEFTNIVDPRQSREVQKEVRGRPLVWRGRDSEAPRDVMAPLPNCGVNFREAYARRPLMTRLPEEVEAAAARSAASLGIQPDACIVTLHVREPGYAGVKGRVDREKDNPRNARIETYFSAVDWLAAQGFTVARIGDPSMTPVRRTSLIDLATSPDRSDALELWLVLNSRFFIASDCGAHNLAVLNNVPCVGVNITQIIAHYPLRRPDRYILKRVWDVSQGREMSLEEMLTAEHLKNRWDPGRHAFIDNTSDEILTIVQDMVDAPEGRAAQTEAQRAFKEGIAALARSKWGQRRLEKPGMNGPFFIGDGVIGDTFARSCLTRQHLERTAGRVASA